MLAKVSMVVIMVKTAGHREKELLARKSYADLTGVQTGRLALVTVSRAKLR
jgi:hypothetical protein